MPLIYGAEFFGSMTYGEEYHGNWYRSPSDGPRCLSRRGATFLYRKGPFCGCPLLAQSGHPELHCKCPLSGGKRTGPFTSSNLHSGVRVRAASVALHAKGALADFAALIQ